MAAQDELASLLQRMKPRMFLWLWQTSFDEKRVLLDRLERLEQMREGTLVGGLPRIVRVAAKDAVRMPTAKTAMRIDPVGNVDVVGNFVFFPFVPLPAAATPLLFHQVLIAVHARSEMGRRTSARSRN
jgi:hypothetical protein